MYAYIQGKISYLEPALAVIDVHGIGYEINISLNTYSAIKDKEECKLLTYLVVKEDSHTLFGFYEEKEKDIFLKLISISGVGPSTGLIVLSSLSGEEIKRAIINGDVKTIQSVKGIGNKTAQRIILELKDKIDIGDTAHIIDTKVPSTSNYKLKNEAISALATLGINKNAAEKTLNSVFKNKGEDLSLEEIIKEALKIS